MLDTGRIRQSDTWTLAKPDVRPWLLMLWMAAWDQSPAGTLPQDDALVAALAGIDQSLFTAYRPVLMRGWIRHADGRLYHRVMTECVLRMVDGRKADRTRQQAWRERKVASGRATRLSADWSCPDEWIDWAFTVHGVDRQRAVRISLSFRDYWTAKPGKDAAKLDWAATWRNWIRKDVGDA
jgi:uncharacterized protein YdaU (DUF1376 family)